MAKVKENIVLILEQVSKNKPPFLRYYEFKTFKEMYDFKSKLSKLSR